jgi:hypothetical protein
MIEYPLFKPGCLRKLAFYPLFSDKLLSFMNIHEAAHRKAITNPYDEIAHGANRLGHHGEE